MAADRDNTGRPRRLGRGGSLPARSRTAGRCNICGGALSTGDDFIHLHGDAVHTDCAALRYGIERALPPRR